MKVTSNDFLIQKLQPFICSVRTIIGYSKSIYFFLSHKGVMLRYAYNNEVPFSTITMLMI